MIVVLVEAPLYATPGKCEVRSARCEVRSMCTGCRVFECGRGESLSSVGFTRRVAVGARRSGRGVDAAVYRAV